MMKIVLIDGEKITTQKKLHTQFKKSLDLPDWYGENLDALYDVLTWTNDEIGVIAVNTELLSNNLGDYWNKFLYLMNDVEGERTGFHFSDNPFKKED